jgi:uncharacterized membrane protein
MEWMTRADWVLISIAAFVAVTSLVRLMQRRRDQVVADVQRQVEAHRKRPKHAGTGDTKKAA